MEEDHFRQWILGIIQKGLKLNFQYMPEQRSVRVTRLGSLEQNNIVKKEIQDLLEKQAIERVPVSQVGSGFYSTFFMVPKRTEDSDQY